jgi:hypothetical protein
VTDSNIDRVSATKRAKEMGADNIGRYWYYATIRYEGRLLALLVQTDDEEVAHQEAEEISSNLGFAATLLDVKKVVIQ